MKVTQQQTEKLLKGNHSFSQLAFSMMLTRLKTIYAKNPASLQSCTDEINTFLDKFQSIMGQTYEAITRL